MVLNQGEQEEDYQRCDWLEMAWLSHFGGLGWGNFDWGTLGGIGIARGVSRTSVRVSRETYPPYCPPLLDNNNWQVMTYIM